VGLLACCAAALAFRRVIQGSYYDYAQAFLIWPLCRTGLLAAVSLAAAAGTWVLARRSQTAGAALLIGVVFLDLYASQAHLIRLTEPNATEGGPIPAPPTPGRFTVAPADVISLRYSHLVSLLGDGPLSGVVTNEGGVLPASLERLHAGLNDPETRDTFVRLAACDLLYDREQRTWALLTNGLDRVRLAGELDLQRLHAEGRFLDLSPGAGDVEVLHETPQHILINVNIYTPSLLIVADCYYPGWGAKVDGHAVPVECVHGCFRAVVVPAGAHRVELAYASSPFRWGVAGTLAGLLLLVLLSLRMPRPGRN
jgi:membrane protein YfhO